MIKAVIFDLDGVLVTTDELHYQAWKQLADEEGITGFTREDNIRQRGVSRMASLEVVLEKTDKQYSDEEKLALAERKNNIYVASLANLDKSAVLNGVFEFIAFLKEKNIKTAVGSASKNTPLILEKTGLANSFDAVSCGLDTQKSKPDPEVFLIAADRLGVPYAECLVIEDSDAGIEAAKAGGMYALAVGAAKENPQADYHADNLGDMEIRKIFESMSEAEAEFKNPPNEYRGKPFWSWNGDLDKEELIRQIHILKKMGMGGFFMHSRVGLKTPYLGEKWFTLINACTAEAKKLGMEAWLYDEDRWPSGTAGGKVTAKKENRMKYITMHIDEEIPENAEVIYEYACNLNGVNYSEDGTTNKLWFEITEFPKSNFYNGYTYADTLKKETTEEYISLTHQKYVEHCGKEIGKTIKGIFTDEPHRGGLMLDSSTASPAFVVPYTEKLFDEFYKMWGYSLKEKLPELFLCKDGERVSPVKWQFVETLQQMFLDNFVKPIQEYCQNNHLTLTGHMLHEDSLAAQTIMQGSLMRSYEHMDIPGVDVLGEQNDNYCIAKQLSSVAHQLGKKWMLSELYGCTGWQMNFEGHKNIGDWQALMGINQRCHHLSWYTMKGEGKRDYPASILHQSAWHMDYPYVEDYFSRLGVFLAQGESTNDCLVISPVESVWCQIHAGFARWLESDDVDIDRIEARYKKLYNMLLESNVSFDFADEEMLSRLYAIENATLKVGAAAYKKVIVSGMLTIRSTTVAILNEFAKNGGEVIVLGDKPLYIDAVKKAVELNAAVMPFTRESVGKLTNGIISAENDKIFAEIKREENTYYIMLLNIDRKNPVTTKMNIGVPGYIEQWCPRSGERYAARDISVLEFEPGEEKLFVITDTDHKLSERKEYKYKKEAFLDTIVSYKLSEKNVCVLDTAAGTIDGEPIDASDVLQIDRRLRERYGLLYRGGEMLQPWFVSERELPVLGRLQLEYAFEAEQICDMAIAVELEDGMRVMVNGVDAGKPNGKWIDICFDVIPISKELLVKGKNSITLEYDFYESSNVEAIYLLGDFGVSLNKTEKTITKLPDKIGFGDLSEFGLPFYSGEITYNLQSDIKEGGIVKLDSMYGAALAKVNDAIVAFRPFEAYAETLENVAVTLVLTRKNTFELLCDENGEYNLLPQGITEPVKVRVTQ